MNMFVKRVSLCYSEQKAEANEATTVPDSSHYPMKLFRLFQH